MIWPRPLREGDTVALIAPSGAISDREKLPQIVQKIESYGYRVQVYESCRARYGYLSGGDALRADDFNRAFSDDAVSGIFCLRGGYGTTRILDRVDFSLAAKHPKVFLGYSDITALHAGCNAQGLVTFHGPMPAKWIDEDWDGSLSEQSLMPLLTQGAIGAFSPLEGIGGARASGILTGGNLTLVDALIGTKWDVDVRRKILFLEDVDEAIYRIDRMLTHLRLAGKFDDCAGIVFGTFTNCENEYEDRALLFDQVIEDIVVPCGKPILRYLQAGHCMPSYTLPLGASCEIDAATGILSLNKPTGFFV
ncbi:MAG: S66 peptidase family protein [Christensenellales bacterium]|jgi:muramoyltetrapeptide carboxypeptidase